MGANADTCAGRVPSQTPEPVSPAPCSVRSWPDPWAGCRSTRTARSAASHSPGVRQAEQWAADRREAFVGLIGLSALLWTIWAVTMWGDFPWPLFPMGFAFMNLVRIQVNKRDIIDEHVKRIEKKERKELKRREEGF